MSQELQNDLQALSRLPAYHKLGLMVLCLLAFSLPFELEHPTLSVGIYQLTNVEVFLLLTVLLALVGVVKERRWQQAGWYRSPQIWLIMLGLFAVVLVLSAVLAPEFRTNALKASFRTLSGLTLAFAIPQIVDGKRQLRWVVIALLAGGLISIGFGLVEILSGQTFNWLNIFRINPTVAGPFARLTGTFNHANQSAMFIEATTPLLLAIVWQVGRKGYRVAALLGCIVIFLYLQASFLTLSRSSFVTLFLSLACIAIPLWLWQPERRKLTYYWGGVAGVVLILILLNLFISPVVRLRLSSEGDNEWYNVRFDVPEQLELKTGEIYPVSVMVTNEGSLHWSSIGEKPFKLGGRWYRLPDEARSNNEMRWTLEQDVAPGETLSMTAILVAPQEPGLYEFEWDMVQEDVIWFSLKNGNYTTSRVTVLSDEEGSLADEDGPEEIFTSRRPVVQPIPNRSVLWAIAARQFVERPFLGLGLDNFRLTYGRVMGWEAFNDTIHTNNMYIEILVSVGILGSIPFFGWLAVMGLDFWKRLSNGRPNLWQIALMSSILAYLIHGLLDYFLMFNGTGLLFWILVGMWMVLGWPKQSA